MTDLDRARDALDWYEAHKFSEGDWGINDLPKPVGILAEFTARFLALTETGQHEWCVLHGAPVWNVASGECIGAHHITPVVPCGIVPAHIVLADYLTSDG